MFKIALTISDIMKDYKIMSRFNEIEVISG